MFSVQNYKLIILWKSKVLIIISYGQLIFYNKRHNLGDSGFLIILLYTKWAVLVEINQLISLKTVEFAIFSGYIFCS